MPGGQLLCGHLRQVALCGPTAWRSQDRLGEYPRTLPGAPAWRVAAFASSSCKGSTTCLSVPTRKSLDLATMTDTSPGAYPTPECSACPRPQGAS